MAKRLGFMFAGQGAQYIGMGRDVAERSAAARRVFETADSVLGRDLSGLCFEGTLADLTASANCQPAVYTVSLACLRAFQEQCAVEPVVCGGLSLGEFAALAAAGALEFADGLKLVAARGTFMDEACAATDGVMAAVLNADPDLIVEVCVRHDVDVANYNCPGQVVISGERAAVLAVIEQLKAGGVRKIILLKVAGAYHSRLMESAARKFTPILTSVPLSVPRCPVAQNVTGSLTASPDDIRHSLKLQVTHSTAWEACVRAMLDLGVDALVEFGPGKVLTGFMRRIDSAFPVFSVGTGEDLATSVAALRA